MKKGKQAHKQPASQTSGKKAGAFLNVALSGLYGREPAAVKNGQIAGPALGRVEKRLLYIESTAKLITFSDVILARKPGEYPFRFTGYSKGEGKTILFAS